MAQAITLLLFFSLLSFNALAGNNLITIQTKGTGTTITTKQAGSSNTTGIYCGLGSFDNSLVNTHNCDNATITANVTGVSNFEINRFGYAYGSDDVLTVAIGGTGGIPTFATKTTNSLVPIVSGGRYPHTFVGAANSAVISGGAYDHTFVTATSNAHKIVCTDTTNERIMGSVTMVDTDSSDAVRVFSSQYSAGNSAISMNGSTTGGVAGTKIKITNVATDIWIAEAVILHTGNVATPFATS